MIRKSYGHTPQATSLGFFHDTKEHMATKLTKPVSREVTIKDNIGFEGPVIVTFDPKGLTLRAKGKKRSLVIPWSSLGKSATLPGQAPAKFMANPLGWLVGD